MAVLPFASYRGIDAPGATTSGDLHDEFVQTADTAAYAMGAGNSRVSASQSWQSGASPAEVAGVTVRTRRTNLVNSLGIIRVAIYAHSGTFGTSSVPTGDPLVASPWYAASDFPTSASNLFFPLSGWTPDATTNYCLVIESDIPFGPGATTQRLGVINEDGAEADHGGNAATLLSSWAANSDDDLAFAVYEASAPAASDEAYRFRGNDFNRRRFGALFGILLMLALGCTSPTAMREGPCFKATFWVDTLTLKVDSVTYEWTPGECD